MPLSEGGCTCTLVTPRTRPGRLIWLPDQSDLASSGGGGPHRAQETPEVLPNVAPLSVGRTKLPQLRAWHMRGAPGGASLCGPPFSATRPSWRPRVTGGHT